MLAVMALQFGGDPKQRAIDGGAIVVGQINDPCLDDEATEFDQMSGTLTSLDLPRAHVIASQSRLPAIASRPVALERREGCAEIPDQFVGTGSRKTSLHAWPMPHALRCLSSRRLQPVRRPVRRCSVDRRLWRSQARQVAAPFWF